MKKTKLELLDILKKTLKIKKKHILLIKKGKLNPGLNSYENWDSLNHMKIILEIEKNYKIKIDNKNFTSFYNYKDIKNQLSKNN